MRKILIHYVTLADRGVAPLCFAAIVVLFFSLPLTAATDLDIEIEPKIFQEFLLKESAIQNQYEAINHKQSFIAELSNELDIAVVANDESRIQDIFHALIIELRQLQEYLAMQAQSIEQYRFFLYRLISSSKRKQSYIPQQEDKGQQHVIAGQIFDEMLPKDKSVIGPGIKSVKDGREKTAWMNEIKFPPSPYRNIAELINKHDAAVLDRVYIDAQIEHCIQLETALNRIVELYIDGELASDGEGFTQIDYDDIRRTMNGILVNFSVAEIPKENPYSISEEGAIQ